MQSRGGKFFFSGTSPPGNCHPRETVTLGKLSPLARRRQPVTPILSPLGRRRQPVTPFFLFEQIHKMDFCEVTAMLYTHFNGKNAQTRIVGQHFD